MASVSSVKTAKAELQAPSLGSHAGIPDPQAKSVTGAKSASHDAWRLESWLAGQRPVVSAIAASLLAGEQLDADTEFDIAYKFDCNKEALIQRLLRGNVIDQLAACLSHSFANLQQSGKVDSTSPAAELTSKFVATNNGFDLKFGSLSSFYGGLEGFVGAPNPNVYDGMRYEHCIAADCTEHFMMPNKKAQTTSQIEWWFVVEPMAHNFAPYPLKKPRQPLPFEAFKAELEDRNSKLDAIQAPRLVKEEFLGGRLYSGPMYIKYNLVLRGKQDEINRDRAQELCHGNDYTTTLHAINSAIIKLSKLTVARRVYRGVSGGRLPECCLKENEYCVKGGVETAFTSTTLDRKVAEFYSKGGAAQIGAPGIVFEVQQGMTNRGADISWLSQFPDEAEVLFGPLTGMEVIETKVDGSLIIVTASLSVNLNSQTLERVIAKLQGTHLSMVQSMLSDLRLSGCPEAATHPLQVVLDEAALRDHSFYNVPDLFLEVTKKALDAKQASLQALVDQSKWAQDQGEPQKKASRMRRAAELCARQDEPRLSAELLVMAVGCEAEQAEHTALVEAACTRALYEPPGSLQRDALTALSRLLTTHTQTWALAMLELARMGGNAHAPVFLALSHRRPISLVMQSLFDGDATVVARKGDALLTAASFGDIEALTVALAVRSTADVSVANGVTPLMLACRACEPEAVRKLLEAGASPNLSSTQGCTALGLASEEGAESVVKLLLSHKASPSPVDAKGHTPLMGAAQRGHAGVARQLLVANASTDTATSSGTTALMFAAEHGHAGVIKALVQGGASINQTRPGGMTSLMLAAVNGCTEAVKTLVEQGADLDLEDNEGDTALDFARDSCPTQVGREDRDTIVQFLSKAGARARPTPVPSNNDDSIPSVPSSSREALEVRLREHEAALAAKEAAS